MPHLYSEVGEIGEISSWYPRADLRMP